MRARAVSLVVAVVLGLVASYLPAEAAAATVSIPFTPGDSRKVSTSEFPSAERDCGFTVPLQAGRTLWIFCDTYDLAADGDVRYFVNNTAGISVEGSLWKVREPTSGTEPLQFIRPSASYRPCTGAYAGREHVIWPLSATVVPGPNGTDDVLIYFDNLCHVPGGTSLDSYVSMSVGLARWRHTPSSPSPVASLAAGPTILDANLIAVDSLGPWAESAVAADDGYLYLYRCKGWWGCQIGRVPTAQVANRSLYRWWTGSGWSTITPDGPTSILDDAPPGSFNMSYVEDMGVYVMGSTAFPGFGTDKVNVRVADHPTGPWSDPAGIRFSDTCGSGCYAGYVNASASGIDHLGVSLYDVGSGRIRLLNARADLEPPPAGVCRSGFSDVWSEHLFCAEITWIAGEGIADGYDDRTFRPASTLTRQGAAAWLMRLAGGTGSCTGSFPDVPFGHPFCAEISWMVGAGVTTGFADGTFKPSAQVTRQALAAWLYRLAGQPEPAGGCASGFPDVPSDHPFCHEIAWMAAQGITTGYADGGFHPDDEVTRQAAAAQLQRYAT